MSLAATPTLTEQISAVERKAKGLPSQDVAADTAALIAAAATLRQERDRRMSATEALDKRNAEDEAWLRSVGREQTR